MTTSKEKHRVGKVYSASVLCPLDHNEAFTVNDVELLEFKGYFCETCLKYIIGDECPFKDISS